MNKDEALAVWIVCHVMRATGATADEELAAKVRQAQTIAATSLRGRGINLPLPRRGESANSLFDRLMEGIDASEG